jgi:hypothetical protein
MDIFGSDEIFIADMKYLLEHPEEQESIQQARLVISTIPTAIHNYAKGSQKKGIGHHAGIIVYSDYLHELVHSEPIRHRPDDYTYFKEGTVGFFVCRYLCMLEICYQIWCNEVKIFPT